MVSLVLLLELLFDVDQFSRISIYLYLIYSMLKAEGEHEQSRPLRPGNTVSGVINSLPTVKAVIWLSGVHTTTLPLPETSLANVRKVKASSERAVQQSIILSIIL